MFGDAKELPNVEKLAELIFHHSKKSLKKKYKDILEGYFSVRNIEQGQLVYLREWECISLLSV